MVAPKDLRDDEIKKTMGLCIELNMRQNTIRNNLMNTSYTYIKNAIICLGVLFLVIISCNNFLNQRHLLSELTLEINQIEEDVKRNSNHIIDANQSQTLIDTRLSQLESRYVCLIHELETLRNSSAEINEIDDVENRLLNLYEQVNFMNKEVDEIKEIIEGLNQ